MAEFTPEQLEWLKNTYASTRSTSPPAGYNAAAKRMTTPEEMQAIQQYLAQNPDLSQNRSFTINGQTYRLEGEGAANRPGEYNEQGILVNNEAAPGAFNLVDSNGNRLQFNGNGQVSDVVASVDPGNKFTAVAQADYSGHYKPFWQFAGIAGAGAAAGMYGGAGGAATGAEMSGAGMEGAAYVGMPTYGAASEAELLAGAGIGAGGGVTNAVGGAGSVTAGANGGAGLAPGAAGGAAAGAAGSAAGGAAGGATSSVLDSLLGNTGFNLRDLLGLLGVAGSAAQGRDDGKEWRDFYQRAAPDLGHYQSALRNVYDDPASYFRGADFQAAQAVTHNKLQRSDAAGGRLAADAGRQNELQKFAINGLNDYRQNLASVVNQNQQIATGTGAAGALGNAQGRENSWLQELLKYINSR